jgi:hypothetical protein
MSFVTAAIINGGATLAAGYLGSQAAKSAANTQADAAREAARIQQEQFALTNEQQKPYREAGYTALSDISGMKPYLTKQFTPEDFAAGIDPGYAFRQQQGQEATNRMANTAGGLIGGNALQGLQNYSQGLASQEYGNAFNRFQTGRQNIYNTLAGIAGLGQNSTNTSATAGAQAAGQVGNTIQNLGAAQAGGTVGAANAITGGIQNAGNQYYLSQLLASKNPAVTPVGGAGGGITSSPINAPTTDIYGNNVPMGYVNF